MNAIVLCAMLLWSPLCGMNVACLPASCIVQEAPEPEEPADETEQILRMLLNQLDLSAWDEWLLTEQPDAPFLPSEFLTGAVLEGNSNLHTKDVSDGLYRLLLPYLPDALQKLLVYVGFGVLTALAAAAASEGQGTLSDGVLRLLAGCMALGMTVPAVRNAALLLESVRQGAQVLLPVLLGFLTLLDCSASGVALSEGMGAMLVGMIELSTGAVFPLAVAGGALMALDGFEIDRLGSVGRLCHRAGRWILRIGSSLYLTVHAMQASVAAQSDSLLLRTTKLAAGSLPYVGGLLAGSAETVYACLRLVRSMLGWAGMIALVLVCSRPVLYLLAEWAALKSAAFLVAPFGQKSYALLLDRMAGMLGLVVSAVVATILMTLAAMAMVLGVWQSI